MMDTTMLRQRSGRSFVAVSIGVLIGGALTLAHVRAAPVETGKGVNTSAEPEIESAVYVPNTLVLFSLHGPAGGTLDEPIYVMTARVELELLDPGAIASRVTEVYGYMYLTEEDLDDYPGPMKMITTDNAPVGRYIDTEDEEHGLEQVRQGFAENSGDEAPN